jgi:uncharacterized membrane protein
MNFQKLERHVDHVKELVWSTLGLLFAIAVTAWVSIVLASWVVGKYTEHFGVN